MAAAVEIQVVVNPTDSAAKLAAVSTEVSGIGTASTAAAAKAGVAAEQIGQHFANHLDGVRLMSQEFGLRMPRALEAMASRVPAITSMISGMMGAFTAVAVAEIFVRIGEEMYKAFDIGGAGARAMAKAISETAIEVRGMNDSLDVQIDKLQQEQAKLEHKPFNGMKLTLDEAAESADRLDSKLEEINAKFEKDVVAKMAGGRMSQIINGGGNTDYEQTMMEEHSRHLGEATTPEKITQENASYAASLRIRLADLRQQDVQGTNSTNHASEIKAIQAMITLQDNLTSATQKTVEVDKLQAAIQADKDKRVAGAMKETPQDVLTKLQHDANEASMRDDALSNEKKLAEIDEVDKKLRTLHATDAQMEQANALISQRYDSQRAAALQKQIDSAEKELRDASAAGLTGLAKIEQVHTNRGKDIDESNVPAAVKAIQHQTADVAYNQDAGAYWQENDEKEGVDADAATKNQLATAEKLQNQMQAMTTENLRYDQQAAEAERRVKEAGAMGWVASYRNAITEIDEQEDARLAKVQQDEDKELELAKGNATAQQQIWESAAQQRVDVEREASAQIEQQQQAMSQKLSGLFESAFKDPIGTIKSTMEKLMFDLLAQWVLHFKMVQGLLGSSLTGSQMGGGARQLGGGILGGAVAHALGSGSGGAAAQISAQGSSSSGASYRAPYAGTGAPGAIGSSGIITGAGSPSSVGSAVSSARNIAGLFGGSGGAAAQISAQGSSSSGASYRAPYAGTGAPGATGSSGMITGAGSSSSVGSAISSARNIAGLFGGSGGSSSAADAIAIGSSGNVGGGLSGGTVGDDSGNVYDTDTIAQQTMPALNMGGVNAAAGSTSSSGLATGLGYVGAAGAAYSAEQTTVGAFDKGSAGGVLSGTLGDAAAGATIGSVIPGIGTAIGAGIGAAVGFASGLAGAVMGMGGRIAARDYYEKTLFPEIEADRVGQTGDAMSAIADVNRAATQGFEYMQHTFGNEGASWVKANYLDKEVGLAISDISKHASGGQQYTVRQAMQFDTGGYIDDFGDMGTSNGHGFIHAQLGETMMNQSATANHAPVLNAMNDGADPSDIASMYLASAKSGNVSAPAQTEGGDHYHFHTLDTGTMTSWLKGGGARMISKAQNGMAAQYAGDGVIG